MNEAEGIYAIFSGFLMLVSGGLTAIINQNNKLIRHKFADLIERVKLLEAKIAEGKEREIDRLHEQLGKKGN